MLLSETRSGKGTRLSSQLHLRRGSQMPFPSHMVCNHLFVHLALGLLNFLSVATTSRGHWTDIGCVFDDVLNTRISITSTFISDLVLLALMVSGVLRWKGVHGSCSTWCLLYKQASPPRFAGGSVATFIIILLILTIRVWRGSSFLHLLRCLLWYVLFSGFPSTTVVLRTYLRLMAGFQVLIILHLSGAQLLY